MLIYMYIGIYLVHECLKWHTVCQLSHMSLFQKALFVLVDWILACPYFVKLGSHVMQSDISDTSCAILMLISMLVKHQTKTNKCTHLLRWHLTPFSSSVQQGLNMSKQRSGYDLLWEHSWGILMRTDQSRTLWHAHKSKLYQAKPSHCTPTW